MTEADTIVSDRDILATNVLPAFETSLQFGATEAELAQELGWRREALERLDTTVSGDSTYHHMEIMHLKPQYAEFVLAAAQQHGFSSLGVVGLACKSVATIGEALVLHHRYQTLTNRTATYSAAVQDARLIFEEQRPATRLGSQLISEYTMFVALHLLKTSTAQPFHAMEMTTRRAHLSPHERNTFERFLGAPITCGAPSARLVLDPSILKSPIRSADPEMERYFERVLQQATPPTRPSEPEVVRDVRAVIEERLIHGTPTARGVARALGLGHRTLQRRLSSHGLTFASLLDATRKTLVVGHLQNPELAISEIAYLLGYSEQASFFRAFRRWHQTTPARFRAGLPKG